MEDWLREFEEHLDTPEALGVELRLSFASIIIKHLDKSGWSQRQLADAAGMKEPVISRLIHGEMNCTLNTIARVLHALNVDADLVERERIIGDSAFSPVEGRWISSELPDHGEKEIEETIVRTGYDSTETTAVSSGSQPKYAYAVG